MLPSRFMNTGASWFPATRVFVFIRVAANSLQFFALHSSYEQSMLRAVARPPHRRAPTVPQALALRLILDSFRGPRFLLNPKLISFVRLRLTGVLKFSTSSKPCNFFRTRESS